MTRFIQCKAVLLIFSLFSGCGVEPIDDQRKDRNTQTNNPEISNLDFFSFGGYESFTNETHSFSDVVGYDYSSESKSTETAELDIHYFLVHGGGSYRMVNLDRFRLGMMRSGIDKQRIHLLRYDHRQPLAQISRELGAQMKRRIEDAPAGTMFDVIGHSLGDFVGLYAGVSAGVDKHIRMHVGMAGVKFGQDTKPLNCRFGCSDVYDKLTPYRSGFIEDFYNQNLAQVVGMQHCAIWSTSDRLVNAPAHAGAFPGGSNHEVSGIGHVGFMRANAWNLVRNLCYKDKVY